MPEEKKAAAAPAPEEKFVKLKVLQRTFFAKKVYELGDTLVVPAEKWLKDLSQTDAKVFELVEEKPAPAK